MGQGCDQFYSYLNLESTKTLVQPRHLLQQFYSYLNLESTKTEELAINLPKLFYSYLNLESTKTVLVVIVPIGCFTVT